eukprot:385994_1
MASNMWKQVLSEFASIYSLDQVANEWIYRGASGSIILLQNAQFPMNACMKWQKNEQEINWRLVSTQLQLIDEQTFMLKASPASKDYNVTEEIEILAVRFSSKQGVSLFGRKYFDIFPTALAYTERKVLVLLGKYDQLHSSLSNFFPSELPRSFPTLPPLPMWQCSVCSYKNRGSEKSCYMCGVPKNVLLVDEKKYNSNEDKDKEQDIEDMYVNNIPLIDHIHDNKDDDDMEDMYTSSVTTAGYVNDTISHTKGNDYEKQPQLDYFTYSNNPLNHTHYWVCTVCTYTNIWAEKSCIICGSSDNKWSCPICTLLNSTNIKHCDACGFKPVPDQQISGIDSGPGYDQNQIQLNMDDDYLDGSEGQDNIEDMFDTPRATPGDFPTKGNTNN